AYRSRCEEQRRPDGSLRDRRKNREPRVVQPVHFRDLESRQRERRFQDSTTVGKKGNEFYSFPFLLLKTQNPLRVFKHDLPDNRLGKTVFGKFFLPTING